MPILDLFEDVVQFHRPRGFESKIRVYRAAAQNIPNAVLTQVQCDTVVFDLLDEYDEAATFLFTPAQSGYYWLHGSVGFPALAAGTLQTIALRVFVTAYSGTQTFHDGVAAMRCQCGNLHYLTPTDTVSLMAYQNSGLGANISASETETYLEVFRVG